MASARRYCCYATNSRCPERFPGYPARRWPAVPSWPGWSVRGWCGGGVAQRCFGSGLAGLALGIVVVTAATALPLTLLGALLAGTFGALMLSTDSAVLSDHHGAAGPAAISEANALAAAPGCSRRSSSEPPRPPASGGDPASRLRPRWRWRSCCPVHACPCPDRRSTEAPSADRRIRADRVGDSVAAPLLARVAGARVVHRYRILHDDLGGRPAPSAGRSGRCAAALSGCSPAAWRSPPPASWSSGRRRWPGWPCSACSLWAWA